LLQSYQQKACVKHGLTCLTKGLKDIPLVEKKIASRNCTTLFNKTKTVLQNSKPLRYATPAMGSSEESDVHEVRSKRRIEAN
jgi:hypothetical protein